LESAAYSKICEHLQELHNAGSWPEARFFNALLVALAGNFAHDLNPAEQPDAPGLKSEYTEGYFACLNLPPHSICCNLLPRFALNIACEHF
jgi:hypothetical protein